MRIHLNSETGRSDEHSSHSGVFSGDANGQICEKGRSEKYGRLFNMFDSDLNTDTWIIIRKSFGGRAMKVVLRFGRGTISYIAVEPRMSCFAISVTL